MGCRERGSITEPHVLNEILQVLLEKRDSQFPFLERKLKSQAFQSNPEAFMKNFIMSVFVILSVSVSAQGALPTPKNPQEFQCGASATKSWTAERLKNLYAGTNFILKENEFVSHQVQVRARMALVLGQLNYGWVTPDQLMNCSNENTEGVDFELLRYAAYMALQKYYIF